MLEDKYPNIRTRALRRNNDRNKAIRKKKLSDSNKNFVKMIVSLLAKLAEAMKQGFKQWAKPIALALIPNLADKNQLLRNECQMCFDKWVEFVGFDSLVIHLPQFLKTDNVESRTEIMKFFINLIEGQI